MTFDKILENNTLWAVRYDGVADNALKTLFDQWSDPEWLVDFFLANMADLESYFKITDINQAKIKERPQHASWLRIYAIKLEPGCYIITGGAIKLTRTMQEREHTLNELNKMEQVRNFLISNQAIDADGFVDFLSELS